MSHRFQPPNPGRWALPSMAPRSRLQCKQSRTILIACSDCALDRRLAVKLASEAVIVHGTPGNRIPTWQSLSTGDVVRFEQLLTIRRLTDLVICGHSRCRTLLEVPATDQASPRSAFPASNTLPGGIGGFMHRIEDKIRQAAHLLERVKQQVLTQLDLLRTYDPVARGEYSGALTLHGLVYLDETGLFLEFRPELAQFVPLDPFDPTRPTAGHPYWLG